MGQKIWPPHRYLSKLGGGGGWGMSHTRTGPGRPPGRLEGVGLQRPNRGHEAQIQTRVRQLLCVFWGLQPSSPPEPSPCDHWAFSRPARGSKTARLGWPLRTTWAWGRHGRSFGRFQKKKPLASVRPDPTVGGSPTAVGGQPTAVGGGPPGGGGEGFHARSNSRW